MRAWIAIAVVAVTLADVRIAVAGQPEPIVILGLRPGSRKLDGPTELRRLGEAQKLRRVANGVIRELASRPIIDDGGLRTILGVEYLVDFMDCRGALACVAKRTAKLKKLATYAVFGEYTVAERKFAFRIKLLDLKKALVVKQVEFTLDENDIEDRKLWRRELEPLFAIVLAPPTVEPEPPKPPDPKPPDPKPPDPKPPDPKPPDGGEPPPGDGDVPELEPITTKPSDPTTAGSVETAAAGGKTPFVDSSVLDAISRGIAWHGHFQNYSAVGVRRGGFSKDVITFDDLLQLEFESDLNHVRVVGKPQLLFNVLDKEFKIQFREMYAARDYERIDFAVGEQIATWGITDFYPVVDIINPRDFSRLRNWRPLDEKLPVPIVQSRALFGPLTLNVLGILQMGRSEYQLDQTQPFALPVPVPPGATVEQAQAETNLANAGGGVRLDLAIKTWKLSGYGLIGRDPLPAIFAQTDPMTFQTRVVVDNDRVAMGAVSLVGDIGFGAILKTEAAVYRRLDDECEGMNADLGGVPQCFYIRRVPTARANIGIERKIASGLEAHVQFLSEITRSDEIPRLPAVTAQVAPGLPEQYPWHRMATLRLRGSWARGDFTPTAFFYWSFDDEDFLVNTDLEYHLADGYTFALGGFLFQGYAADKNKNRFTLAGAQKASSNIYVRVTAFF